MAWPRAILTDSGGFQVFSLSDLRKVTDEGVLFRSHLDGDAHLFTPESTVDVQMALGSDIMMVLDECLAYPATTKPPSEPCSARCAWANSAYRHYLRRKDETGSTAALFPIVQGSMFHDLRAACAEQLVELDAPGYAIGGLSVGEPRPLSLEMTEVTAPLLPRDRPRYVMGVGMPEELAEYVARGVDMMDCVLPSRNARNGCLFTSDGPRDHQAGALPRRSGAVRSGLRLLHLPNLFPRLSPAPVPGRRNAFFDPGYSAQFEALP